MHEVIILKTKLFKLAAVTALSLTIAAAGSAVYFAADDDIPELKVKSLNISDTSVYEGSNYDTWALDSENKRIYTYSPEIKAVLEDGTELEFVNNMAEYNGEYYTVTFDDGQETDTWGVGTHTVTASFGTAQTDFSVDVKPYPIKDVKFDTIEIDEMLDIFDSPRFEGKKAYYYEEPGFTVYFNNGDTLRVNAEDIDMSIEHVNFTYNGCRFLFNFNQYVNDETGNIDYCYSIDDNKYLLDFKINPTAVKNIEVEPVTLNEGEDMVEEESGFYTYTYVYGYSPIINVTLNDGTVCSNNGELNIEINGKTYNSFWFDNQVSEPWAPGEHTFTVEIGPTPITVEGKATVIAKETTPAETNPAKQDTTKPADGKKSSPDSASSTSDSTTDSGSGTNSGTNTDSGAIATGENGLTGLALISGLSVLVAAAFVTAKKKS